MSISHQRNKLEELVSALFSSQNTNPNILAAVNHQINVLVESEDAWSMCIEIITSTHLDVEENIIFFAANILYSKIRKQWRSLTECQKTEIFVILRNVILGVADRIATVQKKVFFNRLLLSFVCVSAYTTDGVNSAMTLIDQLIRNPVSLWLGLEILHLLPVEVEALDLQRHFRLLLEDRLSANLESTLNVVESTLKSLSTYLSPPTKPSSSSGFNADIARSAFSNEDLRNILIVCLKIIRVWRSCGITWTMLYVDHRTILSDLFLVCLQSQDRELVIECCGSIGSSFTCRSHPRPPRRDESVLFLVWMFTCSAGSLGAFFVGLDPRNITAASYQSGNNSLCGKSSSSFYSNEDVVLEVCNCLSTFTVEEIGLLCGCEHFSAELFQLLLSCTSLTIFRKCAMITFDVYIEILNIAVEQRHVSVKERVFFPLLKIILAQISYDSVINNSTRKDISSPPVATFDIDSSEEDWDAFLEFRDPEKGLQEVLSGCLFSLDKEFFSYLSMVMSEALRGLNGADGAEGILWCSVEAVFYLLYLVAEDIQQMMSSTSDMELVEQANICIFNCIHLVLSSHRTFFSKYPLLSRTSCLFLGNYARVISVDSPHHTNSMSKLNFQSFFESALLYVFEALLGTNAATVNANNSRTTLLSEYLVNNTDCYCRAFQCLCSHGVGFFLSGSSSSTTSLTQLRSTLILHIKSQQKSLGKLFIEAFQIIARTISKLSMSTATEELSLLGHVLLEALQSQLSLLRTTDCSGNIMLELLRCLSFLFQNLNQEMIFFQQNLGASIQGQLTLSNLILSTQSCTTGIHEWAICSSLGKIDCSGTADGSCVANKHALLGDRGEMLSLSLSLLNGLFSLYQTLITFTTWAFFHNSSVVNQLFTNVIVLLSDSRAAIKCGAGALKCSVTAVELLATVEKEMEIRPLMQQFVVRITEVMCQGGTLVVPESHSRSTSDSPRHWHWDPECLEGYFEVIQRFQQLCPSLLVATGLVETLGKLTLIVLDSYSERGTIRAVLLVIQGFFFSLSEKQIQSQSAFREAVFPLGFQMISRLIGGLTGGYGISTFLIPYFTDALYYIIRGCEDGHAEVTLAWMKTALRDSTVATTLDEQSRELVVDALMRLSRSDRRRFRVFCQDLAKICSSEMTSDTLVSYTV